MCCFFLFVFFFFFFFNDTATTEIYTLSLHDALPILGAQVEEAERISGAELGCFLDEGALVSELLDSRPSGNREVMAAMTTDAQVLVELVVAVMRAAFRA